MSKQRAVERANRKCQKFHDGLDKALRHADPMRTSLMSMFEELDIDTADAEAAVRDYDVAVFTAKLAKLHAIKACESVRIALSRAGVLPMPEDGGGK